MGRGTHLELVTGIRGTVDPPSFFHLTLTHWDDLLWSHSDLIIRNQFPENSHRKTLFLTFRQNFIFYFVSFFFNCCQIYAKNRTLLGK